MTTLMAKWLMYAPHLLYAEGLDFKSWVG